MAKKVTVPTYLKNVGKSFGYAVGDVFETYNPTITKITKESKNAISSAKASMNKMKTGASTAATRQFNSSSESAFNNLIDDLKTGKWYNKDREPDLFDDFDFGDDWGDEEDSSPANSDDSNSKAILSSMDKMTNNMTGSLGKASAKSAEYIVKNNNMAAKALYDLNREGFTQVSNIMLDIDAKLDGLLGLSAPLAAHMQNSAIFFTTTTQTLNKISDNLEKLTQRTEFLDPKIAKRNKNKTIGSMMTTNGIDIDSYFGMVKDNIKEIKDLYQSIASMGKTVAGKNGKNLNVMQMGLVSVIDALIPKMMKEAMEGFNESIGNAIAVSLKKGGIAASKSSNPLIRLLGRIFLPDSDEKKTYDTSKYHKGPIAWDGEAKMALVHVIPTYLSQILKALGGPDTVYDYKSGKFTNTKRIKEQQERERNDYAARAGGHLRTQILTGINSSNRIKNKDQYIDEVEQFFIQSYIRGEGIDQIEANLKNSSWLKQYGLSRQSAKIIADTIKKNRSSKNRKEVNAARNAQTGIWREQYRHGRDIASEESSFTSNHRALSAETEFGSMENLYNAQTYYLKGIYEILASDKTGTVVTTGTNVKEIKRSINNAKSKVKGGGSAKTASSNAEEARIKEKIRQEDPDTYFKENVANKTGSQFKSWYRKYQSKKDMTEIIDKGTKKVKDTFKGSRGEKAREFFGKAKSAYEKPFEAVSNLIWTMTDAVNDIFWGEDNGMSLIDRIKSTILERFINPAKDLIKEEAANIFHSMTGTIKGWFAKKKNTETGEESASGSGLILGYAGGKSKIGKAVKTAKKVKNTSKKVKNTAKAVKNQVDDTMDKTGVGDLLSDGAHLLYSGVVEFLNRVVHGSAGGAEKEKESTMKAIGKVLGEATENKGALLLGGLTGAGVSLLTGAVVGPLAGAAIGAGVGLLAKSDTLQQLLFGKKPGESDEEYEKSMRKSIVDFMQDQLPTTATAAALGGTAGFLLGSPVAGAILGGAIGFVSSSDKLKDLLFGKVGEDGYREGAPIPKELQKAIKEKAPNLTAGAIAGLLIGPFGSPIANIIFGSALGYMSTSEKFKEFIFGEGGVADKVSDIVHNLGNAVSGGIRRMGIRLSNMITNLNKKLNDTIEKLINSDSMMGKIIGKAAQGVKGVLNAPVRLADSVLGSVSTGLKKRNLRKGDAVYDHSKGRNLTAEERLQLRDTISNGNVIEEDGEYFRVSATGKRKKISKNTYDRISQRAAKRNEKGKTYRTNNTYTKFDKMYAALSKEDKYALEKLDEGALNEKLTKDLGLSKNLTKIELAQMKELMRQENVGLRKADAEQKAKEEADVTFKPISHISDTLDQLFQFLVTGKRVDGKNDVKIEDIDPSRISTTIGKDGKTYYYYVNNAGKKTRMKNSDAEKILGKSGGESSESVDDKDDGRTTIPDALGNPRVYDADGNEVNDDKDSVESKKTMEKFTSAVLGIPFLGGAINKMTGFLGGIKDGLFGSKEKGTNGLLSMLGMGISSLVSTLTFGKVDLAKLAGKLPNFIGSVKGGISKLFTPEMFKFALSDIVAPGLLFGGFTGKFDDVAAAITNKNFNPDSSKESAEMDVTDKDGNSHKVIKDENGNYRDITTGEYVDVASVDSFNAGRDSLSDKLKKNTARGILTGKASVASKVLGNTKVGKALTKGVAAAGDDMLIAIYANIDDALKAAAKYLKNVPFLKNVDLDGMFGAVSKKIGDALGSASAEKLAKAAANAVVIARIAFAVADFTTGYEDARTTLGIVQEPTLGQKILSGLLRVVKNLIPIVGTLIPDSLVIDVFCDYVAPALGIDVSELKAQRAESQNIVDKYNAENQTSYTVGDFNKQVLHDYTWTERISNGANRTVEDAKVKFGNFKDKVKEKGLGGALKDSFSNAAATFMDEYQANGGGVTGIIKGIGANFQNMLPGVLGDIAKANADIMAYASKGEFKNLWTVEFVDKGGEKVEGTDLTTAVPSVFTRIIGQFPLITTKVMATPVALVAKIGIAIKGIFDKIVDKVKSVGETFIKAQETGIDHIMQKDDLSTFLDTSDVAEDPENPLSGFMGVVAKVGRLTAIPIVIVRKIGKDIKEAIEPRINAIKTDASAFGQSLANLFAATAEGNTESMGENFFWKASDMNPIGGLFEIGHGIAGVYTVIGGLFARLGGAVKEFLAPKFEAIGADASAFKESLANLFAATTEGDTEAMGENFFWQASEANPIGGLFEVGHGIAGVYTVIGGTISRIGTGIKEFFGKKFDAIGTDASAFGTAMDSLKTAAESGEISQVSAVTFEASDDNIIGGIFNIGFKIAKAFNTVGAVFNKIVGPIKDLVGGFTETVGDIADKVKDIGADAWNSLKEGVSNVWGSFTDWVTGGRSGLLPPAGGASFVNQNDPKYQGYNIGGTSFGDNGCGPAVASMAASALGKNLSVNSAVRASQGYQTTGGVTLDYFKEALGSQGIKTQVIAGGGAGDLYNSIASGNKVVLLGRDPYNTSKANSPFGPHNHYVLATGLDSRGNVVVNDPEARGPVHYSPAILNSASYGIAAGGRADVDGTGRVTSDTTRTYGSSASASATASSSAARANAASRNTNNTASTVTSYSTPDANSNTQIIWSYLRDQGLSEAAVAGIMGNMQVESGCIPDRHQTGGTAYGLCQWDGGRKTKLMQRPNYQDIYVQLNYLMEELPSQYWKTSGTINDVDGNSYRYSGMSFEDFKALTDVATATIKFEAAFERAGKPNLARRIQHAKEFYEMYTGQTYEYDAEAAAKASENEGLLSKAANGAKKTGKTLLQMASSIGSVFSDAFGKIFNPSTEEESASGEVASKYGAIADYDAAHGNIAVNSNATATSGIAGALDYMRSKLGQVAYSMTGPRNPDAGSADCSSTVQWAIKKATGIDIGGNTSTQYENSNLTPVWYGNGSYANSLPSNIQPGDVLFFRRDKDYTKGRKDRVGHVGLYEGDGMMIDHGSGMGPKRKQVPLGADGKLIKVSRVTGAGAGSGIRSYNDFAQAGGASGLLLASRAGSVSGSGLTIRDPRSGKLVPVNFAGGASNMVDSTTAMLGNIANKAAKSGSGIPQETVIKLIDTISQLLASIANNTAPIDKIYNALVSYLQSGGASHTAPQAIKMNNKKEKDTGAKEVDEKVKALVGVLADLAKG